MVTPYFPLIRAAAAETISFSGTVEASETAQVYGTAGLTVETVPVRVGQAVTADTVIATLKTTKVYAPEDGVVGSVCAQEGDGIDGIIKRYGAVLYIEPTNRYIVSASTEKAFNSSTTKYIHIGEMVCRRTYGRS